ncbi:codanin-1 isoform X2 [Athalia rosae]|uniref:codanin-1 isoform X2 n=1 Tax=Athalia rosae TaxID=37344 RepID=UPI00203366CB|nr:codanin-1 isoform X2 [Athalia rosae]
MANLLLQHTLSGKIPVEDVINWLTSDNTQDFKWIDITTVRCTQCEFLIYFLNFLRDQTKSVLQSSCNARQSTTKPISPYVATSNNKQNKNDNLHRRISLSATSANQTTESGNNCSYGISVLEGAKSPHNQVPSKISVLLQKEISPATNTGRMKTKIPLVNVAPISELKSLMNSLNTDKNQETSVIAHNKTPDKIERERTLSSSFDLSPNKTTSTPIIERNSRSKTSKTFNGFSLHEFNVTPHDVPTDQNFQLHSCLDGSAITCKDSESYQQDLRSTNENFDTSNCLLISKNDHVPQKLDNFSKSDVNDSSSVHISSIFDGSNNEWRYFNNLNISSKSEDSRANESQGLSNSPAVNDVSENAISPLFIREPLTPQNSKLLYSRSLERSQNAKSSPQYHTGNTSKQGPHHSQRISKLTPRQSMSLGDFISIDSWGSRKNGTKKTHARTPMSQSNECTDSLTDKLSMTEESFPEIGKNPGLRKRRIKPTKLDVSGDKGNSEKSTFGTISRPQIVNPQFSEAMPTDKADATRFETERDLLRLERQKQQKNLLPNQTVEHAVHSNVLQASNVKKSTGPFLTPSLKKVVNSHALDILAQIYSSLLDLNLVLNPMTELNFMISLITLQYSSEAGNYQLTSDYNCLEQKNSVVKSSSKEKNLDDTGLIESDENLVEQHENSKKLVDVELFNEELGCKILTDGIILTTDKNETSPDYKSNEGEVFDNLTKSSMDDIENSCKNESCLCEGEEAQYLDSIHNCIYFSTAFLNTQRLLLSSLDRATLKLLCENNRIDTFLPDLREYLTECYKLKLTESSRSRQYSKTFSAMKANVSFQIDTDNQENFPSITGFHSFKKQRDLFYETLRIWESYHLSQGWIFSLALAGRIRQLLTLHNDPANYCHFARLFKSQLLLSCIGNGQQEDAVDDESLSFLKSIKHLDPDKLTRLRERLVTPLISKGPVPPPSFPGVQEFYKEFIFHASNPMFYAHLQDCLVHEIMELNDTQFTGSEIENTETMVDAETKQNFLICISSLRLLAKMLGFLVSLPYESETSLETVLASQITPRSQVLPPLNLQSCIQNAMDNGKLVLTIPWVVKYLAMLDPVSVRLPYYRKIFEMLLRIYCEAKHDSERKNPLSPQVAILLKFSIGWLLELRNFPVKLYFTWKASKYDQEAKSINNSAEILQNNLTVKMEQETHHNQSNTCAPCADCLDIIDDHILYVCCPFLAELKTLLTCDYSNLNNSTTIRHITPVSSGFEKPLGNTSTKQLQLQLEDAFFHGQPVSTRKTVDFVSERVASSYVKHICNVILPRARKRNILKFQDLVSGRNMPNDMSLVTTEMHSLASSVSAEVITQCEADMLGMCESRINKSIEHLLAMDTLPPVKEMCAQIAFRMASERVNYWIQSHIASGPLFLKDLEGEINKVSYKKVTPAVFAKRIHNDSAASPTNAMVEIRSLIWDLLENKSESVTLENVSQCLDNLYQSLTEREDLLPGPEKILGMLSVDFALFLVAHRTDIFVTEIQDKLIRVWKLDCLNFSDKESILSRILSPRNIMLLASPGNANVWLALGRLIRRILQEKLLSIEALSDECTALLRYDWTVKEQRISNVWMRIVKK